ncbi:MAG TPA: alkaline phosphatase D family protein [Planctomycetota bacterium]|jgi:alkaline phosphatase D|nr:alkaline phosphatase D family protein [Planctomycetota bacterium]
MSSLLLALLPLLAPQIIGESPRVLGPFVGHVGPREAVVFARFDRRDPMRLALVDGTGKLVKEREVTPVLENDLSVRWDLTELEPDSSYAISVGGQRMFFKTTREPDKADRVRIAFGSCADDRPGLPNPVWPVIAKDEPDTLVLIGDTPYIDSTDLTMQRRRYVEFLANPDLTKLLQKSTFYATWDDHDFAKDGADGTTPDKANARRAFLEHHGNPSAGTGEQGIYTRFRRGPADVFLLDTRWFSGTATSFADATKPTLLGAAQWEWLQRELAASTAPFKLLVSGMMWNGAVRPAKPDTWDAYPYERAAVFHLVAEKGITGVVLVSGDLHRSRVFVHPPEETGIAYPVRELVTSPLGTNPTTGEAPPDPSVVFDRGEKHAYLLATVDSLVKPPLLTASFRTAAAGEIFKLEIAADELRAHSAIVPVPREDDGGKKRTDEVLARAKKGPAELVFLGDSITEGWEEAGKDAWDAHYAKRKAVNFGVGGDRTQHVLWRIDHGQLDGVKPKLVVLMIGTNNANGADNSSAEIGQGIAAVVGRIRHKCPDAKILLLAVFPRGEKPNELRTKNDEASHFAAEAAADGKIVRFLDIGPSFVGRDGMLPRALMPDELHPSKKGYEIWAGAIEAQVKEMLGD